MHEKFRASQSVEKPIFYNSTLWETLEKEYRFGELDPKSYVILREGEFAESEEIP